MADSGGVSKKSDSMEMFDLIVSDNFEKESSDKLPNSGPTDYLYSGGSGGGGGNTTRRSQHDENNVELYDIIARDNFHTYEISDSAQISDTVLSNLPGGVVDSLKPAANVTNTPVLPISQTPSESSEEYAQLVGHCEETSERLRVKSELRKSNTMPVRDESKLSKLDSSLKKNSAFVKKLKNFTSQQLDSLLKDLALLNLSKYMSEVTSALVEVKLKLTDIPSVLSLCSELHRVYAEFSKLFFDQWSRTLSLKKDDKVANLSKLRVDLRFYGDLISCGIFQTKEAFCLLGNVLTFLTATDKEEHNNLSIITSFCKYCGEDFAGLIPKHIQSLARKYNMTVPKSDLIPAEKQKNVKLLLVEYFYSLCRHLLRYNSELKSFEKQNQRILASKGELRQERRDQFESQVGLLKKLTSSAETFADLLGETLPDIPKDKCVGDESNMTGSIVSICGTESEDGGMNFNSIWDDEEMQSFYQDIPYLKDFLPHLKVKVSSPVDGEEPWKSKGTPTAEEMISDDKIDEEINKLTQLDEENVNPDQQPNDTMLDHDATSDQPNDGETKENDQVIEDKVEDAKEVGGGGDKEKEQSPVTSELSAPGGFNMNNVVKGAGGIDSYLANLYKCENREMIDNAAIEFIMYHNTRTNRKKLTNTLLFVPRTRLDLLPFLSRFVAILYPFQPDISTDLTTLLKNDFKYHTKKKDQINIESKIKNVRYIGELVKFKLYSKIEVLYCLKVLLNDFAHHHVEMCCHLLETCGRYLYRNKDTHARIKIYLEQMIRKRTVLNLDARYNMMIENAFYCVNPPEVPVSKKKDKPVMQLFIEKIVYGDLMNALDNQKDTEAKVLTQLLKLDWNDEQVVKYVVRVFSQPWRVKYDLIRKLANVLAGLVEYEEGEGPGVQVVDNVTEDIRACLETNHPRHNQRRLAVLKYFGELYNYRLIESNDVFKVLYSLITFGVAQTDNGTNGSLGAGGTGNSTIPLLMCDPPENLFRIKLVCVLLETCGQYFSHGATRTKLDYFVVFFQTYFWSKVSHPLWKDRRDVTSISIANYNREVLTALRPNIRLAKDYEEAVKASAKLLAKLPLGEITNTREGEERGGGGGQARMLDMGVIAEEDDGEEEEKENNIGEERRGRKLSDERRVGGNHNNAVINNKDRNGETNTTETDGGRNASETDETAGNSERMDIDDEDEETEEFSEEMPLEEDETDPPQLEDDDDFLPEFEKMVSDNLQERTREMTHKNKLANLSVPVNFGRSNLKQNYEQLTAGEQEAACTINFMLMVRTKSNKQSYKPLVVPKTCDLVLNLKSQEKAKKDEMEQVKKLTLNITDRLEEEDYHQEVESGTRNLNHGSHHRSYKHQSPKGPYTPDAELIFGKSKKSYASKFS